MIGFEQIRQIVETRMSQWDGVPVAYDGVPNSPVLQAAIDNKESWVRCVVSHGGSITAYVGDGPKARRTGHIRFNIFTPLDRGSRPAAMIADSLAEHFEYWQSGHFSTQAASVSRTGPEDGTYRYVVRIEFTAG